MPSQQWIISAPPVSPPEKPLPNHPVFQTWEGYMGQINAGQGDYEHFVEQAFRLHSAVTSFGPENIWILPPYGMETEITMVQNLSTDKWESYESLIQAGAKRYGAIPGTRHSHGNDVDDYCTLNSFKKFSGRVTGLGGFSDLPDESSSIETTLAIIKRSGANEALLKRRHAKLSLIRLPLDNWNPGDSFFSCVGENDGWALINDEGLKNAYLVQEVIPMRFEYRFFVIGGKVVTGAGCVENLTPLDNDGSAFDDNMKEFRVSQQLSPVEPHPEILSQYLAFAERVVEEIREERPDFDRYVLDVALGRDGSPVIVELNSESNAGFYACNPQLITDALYESV